LPPASRNFATAAGRILSLIYLAGIYTNVHLYIGGNLVVPTYWAGFAGAALLIINIRKVEITHFLPLTWLLLIAWFSMAVHGIDNFTMERVKGFLQLSYSIILSYALFLELSGWRRSDLRKLFYAISLALIFGCLLENHTALKEVSDAFRHSVFSEYLYEASSRDAQLFGRDRPKLFTAEPSFVGVSILFFLSTWVSLSRPGLLTYLQAVALCSLAIYATGSPFLILFFIPILPVIHLLLFEGGIEGLAQNLSRRKIIAYILLLLGCLAVVTIAGTTLLAPRLQAAIAGGGSAAIRLLAPPLITLDALQEDLLWGMGIAAKEAFEHITFDRLYYQFNVTYLKDMDNVADFITNAFWLHWIYFGLLGGCLVVAALYRLMSGLGVRHRLYSFTMIAIYGQTMGGYVNLKFWSIFFCIMLTSSLFRDAHEGD
jgi:hypothetical protein